MKHELLVILGAALVIFTAVVVAVVKLPLYLFLVFADKEEKNG